MSSKEIAISVKDIHKNFILPQHKNTSLKQTAVNIVKKNDITTQKVLDGVSFDIYKGEFFGIVGRNGSGKSTLLKLIAGVYAPTSGAIEMNGGLTPFIELGVGFNPELSGRDNVFLNGALLGYTRKQMEAMYDDIVDFAEIEEHMDKKLKNYSSGMQVRLAFSIAIKAKNDILIFDEVLAVGDEAFQKKCMAVFREYKKNKQTIVLVTHSMEYVTMLCTRALMLEDGKIVEIGDVKKVARAYQKSNVPLDVDEDVEKDLKKQSKENVLRLTGAKKAYKIGETMEVSVHWPKDVRVAWVGVSISGVNGEYVFGTNTGEVDVIEGGMVNYRVDLNLGPGDYDMAAAIKDEDGNLIDSREKIAPFSVYNDYDPMVGGLTRMKYSYTLQKTK